jgi:hypothetical protein
MLYKIRVFIVYLHTKVSGSLAVVVELKDKYVQMLHAAAIM